MRLHSSHIRWAIPLAALVAGIVGCGSGSQSEPTRGTGIAAPPSVSAVPLDFVTVADARGDALAAAIAKFPDKVIVVDFWATWCVTCVKKFPHFVELHRKYADKGLVCISVNVDKLTPSSYKRDEIVAFLQKKGATFPNYIATEPDDDDKAIGARFGEDFRLLSYMVIFDKAGRRIWNTADGPNLTDEQLERKIVELLAK